MTKFMPAKQASKSEKNMLVLHKICRSKCFQRAWFEEFPSWKKRVLRLEDETKFYCTICVKTMECSKAQIWRHESTLGHQQKEHVSNKLTSYGILCKSNSSNLTSHVSNVDYFAADQQFRGFWYRGYRDQFWGSFSKVENARGWNEFLHPRGGVEKSLIKIFYKTF